MDKKTDEKLKTTFNEVGRALKDKSLNLSPEERQKLEQSKSALAGAMLSSWLPADGVRRAIMLVLLIIGLYGFIHGKLALLVFWLILLLFSPRIVGEVVMLLGRISRK
ncbi:MAG: hypothetical protein AAB490_06250 [Patescibacteria group bacterium]